MAHKTRNRPSANKRAIESFKKRYNMTRAEFRELKKTNPQKAQELRVRAYNLFIKS